MYVLTTDSLKIPPPLLGTQSDSNCTKTWDMMSGGGVGVWGVSGVGGGAINEFHHILCFYYFQGFI